jgi:hypothetical protein
VRKEQEALDKKKKKEKEKEKERKRKKKKEKKQKDKTTKKKKKKHRKKHKADSSSDSDTDSDSIDTSSSDSDSSSDGALQSPKRRKKKHRRQHALKNSEAARLQLTDFLMQSSKANQDHQNELSLLQTKGAIFGRLQSQGYAPEGPSVDALFNAQQQMPPQQAITAEPSAASNKRIALERSSDDGSEED